MPAKILVVDDEDSMCRFMEIMLSKEGYEVQTADCAKNGITILEDNQFDLVIADLNMPNMTGLEMLSEVKSFRDTQDFVVMTAYATVDTAIDAMKRGAADYITKPFKIDEIKMVIEKIFSRKNLERENSSLKSQLKDENSFDKFIGSSEIVDDLKKMSRRVATTDSTVLIRGESGTGKDLIARAIHHYSPRSGGPFITINCGALPENLLESELFGHKKGSFTGAIKDKEGLFQVADGGTFFLDELGNTSLAIQMKLLRVLEDKKITPVGGTTPIEVDVRLIAATNADLEEDVKTGRFREDLFYRLNVLPIDIKPLRERSEDIPLLIEYFIQNKCFKANMPKKEIDTEALELLTKYRWPGNVRELENTIERAVLLNRTGRLSLADFPEKLKSSQNSAPIGKPDAPLTPTMESIEKAYIHFVLTQTEGNKTKAAQILGIDPSTLYRKIERYNLKEMIEKI